MTDFEAITGWLKGIANKTKRKAKGNVLTSKYIKAIEGMKTSG